MCYLLLSSEFAKTMNSETGINAKLEITYQVIIDNNNIINIIDCVSVPVLSSIYHKFTNIFLYMKHTSLSSCSSPRNLIESKIQSRKSHRIINGDKEITIFLFTSSSL